MLWERGQRKRSPGVITHRAPSRRPNTVGGLGAGAAGDSQALLSRFSESKTRDRLFRQQYVGARQSERLSLWAYATQRCICGSGILAK